VANVGLVLTVRQFLLHHDAQRSVKVLLECLPFPLDYGCFRQNICFGRIAFCCTIPQVAQNLSYGAALSHMTELFAARDGFPAGFGVFTESVDVDALNLQLAAKGRGISSDVRTDFKEKNKSSCLITPFARIPNLHFMSNREHDLMFRNASTGWSDFHKKYGKQAEILFFSRVGFNSEKTLALLHVSGGTGLMGGGGTLYLLDRKNGKWAVKALIQTWAT
jgi:hypothetical protein